MKEAEGVVNPDVYCGPGGDAAPRMMFRFEQDIGPRTCASFRLYY